MTVLDLFVSAVLAQVTLISVVALIVIWLGRRHSAFRHAVGVVGLVLVVASPLLVLALPRPAWLRSAMPSVESAAPVIVESATRPSAGAREPVEVAGQPDADGTRLSGGPSVMAAPAAADSNVASFRNRREFNEIPGSGPSAAESPLNVESSRSVESSLRTAVPSPAERSAAAPSAVEPHGLRDVVPAQPADAVPRHLREWSLSTLFRVLAVVWSLGILVTAGRDWRRRRELGIITRTARNVDPDRFGHVLQDVRRTLGLTEVPQIRVSDLAPLPFVLGLRSPVVVLPEDFAEAAPIERVRDVLIHECAHIVRRDSWVHLLQRISAIVFWFHPAVALLNAQIGRAREELCDNFVLMAGDAAEYAELLLDLSVACGGKRLGLSALGLLSTRWTLEQRVGGLLDPGRDRTTRTWRGTLVLLTVLFASLSLRVGGVRLVAQEETAKPKPAAATGTKLATETNAKPEPAAESKPAPAAESKPEPVADGKKEVKADAIAETSAPSGRKITVRGKCVDDDGQPVANATVRLVQDRFRIDSISKADSDPATVISEVKSDASGEFVFKDVNAPPSDPHPQHQRVMFVTATAEGRASAVGLESWRLNYSPDDNEIVIGSGEFPFLLSKDRLTVSGVVTDPSGRPVAGARVYMGTSGGNPIPGMWSAVTDQAGRYAINDLERWKKNVVEERDPDGSGSTTITTRNSAAAFNSQIRVFHPQYAITTEAVSEVPKTVDIKLKPPAIVEGKVVDQITSRPAADVVVFAKGIGHDQFVLARTDASGRYRLQLLKDHYNIWVESHDRIAPVLKAVPAAPDKPVTNADFQLVRGGFVVGTVIDDATNKPLAGSKDKPYIVAHYGPACVRMDSSDFQMVGVPELSIGVPQETRVNPDGSFRLRVAPGRNGVYFIENYGETLQSPQIVTIADGEEKTIELRVKRSVPEDPAEEGVHSATPVERWTDAELDADNQKFLLIRRDAYIEAEQAKSNDGKAAKNPSLAKVPSRERRDSAVNRLLDKFERQSIGDENYGDPWLRTIKDIVDLGPAAVPELIEELEATEDPWMLQLLGFTLRAINDRRAVPALIRAIPKTIPSSEPKKKSFTLDEWRMYRRQPDTIMLTANDPELRTFAQANQREIYLQESNDEDRKRRYTLNSPAEEIFGAITKLTGARNGEEQLDVWRYTGLSPEQIRDRQKEFQRVADRWSDWWQQHQNEPVVVPTVSPEEARAIETLVRRKAHLKRDGTMPGSPVTRVFFGGNGAATEDDLNLLKAFPNLQDLSMPSNVDPPAGGMKIVGELHSLTTLYLGSTNVIGRSIVGSGLKELRGLTQLKSLTVGSITNKDLREICQFKSLTKLEIHGSNIDDAGMKELKNLENLEELEGGTYNVTDVGVADLADVKRLKKLNLNYSKITDASLKELKRLTNLQSLDLSHTKIKGLHLDELKDLQQLKELAMTSTRIGDAAAEQIAELKSLTSLELTDTKITDEALKQFEHLPALRYLKIKETEVTDEAVRELKKARPYLNVETE
jgi:beta-lactamase regulating signal transducer with metallopeptidase domain/protocatechuate 3,4-dioxygenase beta subunit